MAEILGVLASAAQLVQYTLKLSAAISAVHDRVHNAQELRSCADQIQHLLDTALQIQQNPQVHNSSVLRHLASATDEAKSIIGLLERSSADYSRGSLGKRYFKAARGGKNEKKITAGFRRLEQEKTSLLFCIGLTNTERLSHIQTEVIGIANGMSSIVGKDGVRIPAEQDGIVDMSEAKPCQDALVVAPRKTPPHLQEDSTGTALQKVASNGRSRDLGHSQKDGTVDMSEAKRQDALVVAPRKTPPHLQEDSTGTAQQKVASNGRSRDPGHSQKDGSATCTQAKSTFYEGCSIVGENNNASQYNGHLGEVAGMHIYRNCTATGNGKQLNGSATGEAAQEIAKSFFTRSEVRKLESEDH